MSRNGRPAALLLLVAALAVSGCSSKDATTTNAAVPAGATGATAPDQAALDKARADGAAQAKQEAKAAAQRKEQQRLRKQIADLKRRRAGGAAAPAAPAAAPAQPAPAAQPAPSGLPGASCGGGLYVGPNTTCGFAASVRAAYISSPGNVVEAYSPATDRTYTMTCEGNTLTTCRGGNNATVYFT